MRKKAAEELKKEQERKAAERRRIIEERCGKPKNVADANEGIFNVKQISRKVQSLNFFYHLTFNCYYFNYYLLLFITIIPPPILHLNYYFEKKNYLSTLNKIFTIKII